MFNMYLEELPQKKFIAEVKEKQVMNFLLLVSLKFELGTCFFIKSYMY